jgi:hypothetical protein
VSTGLDTAGEQGGGYWVEYGPESWHAVVTWWSGAAEQQWCEKENKYLKPDLKTRKTEAARNN